METNSGALSSSISGSISRGGISSSSEHAADFFHNYYSNRGYALDNNNNNNNTDNGFSRAGETTAASSSFRLKTPSTVNHYGELTVYSWGRGEDGQLGIGDTSDQDEPTYVDALRGVGVKEIACGSGHTVVLTGEGEVYTWYG